MRAPPGKATAASVGTVTVIAAAFGALDDAVVVGERQAIAGAEIPPGAPSRDQRRDDVGDVLRRE